ncbi:MAG: hypothetical protein QOI03_2453, partial [Solirubrobacteraceae bacterium]|nr:hypothetical protein [Solirubrobacteraceae bacterium]
RRHCGSWDLTIDHDTGHIPSPPTIASTISVSTQRTIALATEEASGQLHLNWRDADDRSVAAAIAHG